MDYLEDAQATDARYHQAKLITWAQWAPDELHKEHAEWRAALLSPTLEMSRQTLEERALAMLQRSRRTEAPAAGVH